MNNPSSDQRHDSTDTNDRIASRAYAFWEQGGREDGRALEHWLRAERELAAEDAHAGQLATSLESARPGRRTPTPARPIASR